MLINKTKVKEIVGNMQMTKEFTDSLDNYLEETIKKSCKRARDNGRNTVMGRDI
ncbi:MAG: hypothetical protein ACMXYG_06415 [Candidatus Woesearchaeota archaeon]